jgi:hypothetical protein
MPDQHESATAAGAREATDHVRTPGSDLLESHFHGGLIHEASQVLRERPLAGTPRETGVGAVDPDHLREQVNDLWHVFLRGSAHDRGMRTFLA